MNRFQVWKYKVIEKGLKSPHINKAGHFPLSLICNHQAFFFFFFKLVTLTFQMNFVTNVVLIKHMPLFCINIHCHTATFTTHLNTETSMQI